MEEKRMFGVAELRDLQSRLAVKETLEQMYKDAKEQGYAASMYNALVELGEQGLINTTDRRLKPEAMAKLENEVGHPLEEVYVDENAAAELKWMKESRTRYGGNKMTDAEEIAYLENKAAGTAGRPRKDGTGTSNGAKRKSEVSVTGLKSGSELASEARVAANLTKTSMFNINVYEHVGVRREYGQVGLCKVPEITLDVRVSEVKTSYMATRLLDKSLKGAAFTYGLVKDIPEFVQGYENRRKTLLEVRKASGTLGVDYLAVVEVAWGKRDGQLAANARVGINKKALVDNHIDMQEFNRKLTEAVKESLCERNGSACDVKVMIANVKQEDINKQKEIKKRDKNWLVRFNSDSGDKLLREVLFEEEKAARR